MYLCLSRFSHSLYSLYYRYVCTIVTYSTRVSQVKYLPNIKLPKSIVAVNDLAKAVSGAEILIWVVPHQFVSRMIDPVKANMVRTVIGP